MRFWQQLFGPSQQERIAAELSLLLQNLQQQGDQFGARAFLVYGTIGLSNAAYLDGLQALNRRYAGEPADDAHEEYDLDITCEHGRYMVQPVKRERGKV